MSTIPIRVGVLGAARIVPIAISQPALGRSDIEVRYIAARDHARAKAFAHQHGISIVESDYGSLVAREDVDLVYIALPAAFHRHWCEIAAQHGKAVLCEKPFAMSASEAVSMVEVATQAGTPLIEAFHYRFHDAMRSVIEIVSSGRLGPIVEAEAVFEAHVPRSSTELRWNALLGGGALMDFGCYTVNVLRALFGMPCVLDASSTFIDGVDAVTEARLTFPGGIRGRIRCSMVARELRMSLVVKGEAGQMTVTNFILPQRGCRIELQTEGRTQTTCITGPTTYEEQLAHVLDVLRGRTVAITGGRDAIETMMVIDAIRELAA